MRTAPTRLLTILAVASLSAAGCGDDKEPAADSTNQPDGETTNQPDGETTNQPDGETTNQPDGETTNEVGPDAEVEATGCGLRECGTFGNLNCGDCDDKPGTECNDNGRCVVPGGALGAFCGITGACVPGEADYPACLDAQCETGLCMANTGGGGYVFALIRDWGEVVSPNSFCTSDCIVYADDDGDSVNDADQQDDCNPPGIVNGPVGNSMRCVNFAGVDDNPQGLCLPGSNFDVCTSDSDCPSGEGCELTTIGGNINGGGRCIANYKAGAWGDVVGLGESCNRDPAEGTVELCESGFCFGGATGCSTGCGTAADCVDADAKCQAGECAGKPGKTCTGDADCSSMNCVDFLEVGYTHCLTKECADDLDCGGGFSCDWRWNQSVRNAAVVQECTRNVEDGVAFGEPCDPDPDDTEIINGGDVCASNLCIGETCSAICSNDTQCGDALCAFYEFATGFIACDVAADCGAGNGCTAGEEGDGACYDLEELVYIEGEGTTFALGLNFCTNFDGATGSCNAAADCAAGEVCELYAKQNFDGETVDPDAPVTIEGFCMAADGGEGELGEECEGGADCKDGFCLPVTDSLSICTKPCTASADCGSFNVGEDPVNGYCDSYLYAFAGDVDNFFNYTYVGLCVFDFGSTADCSDDFTCDDATEACFPNSVAGADPTKPGVNEALCFQLWETADDIGTKGLGEACDPAAETAECASGICSTEVGDDTVGYCSALCTQGGDECGDGALSCTELIRNPRAGEYEPNTNKFNLCLKDQACLECGSHLDCPGSLVCANLNTAAAPEFRCVQGCEEVVDCADSQVTTACNDTTDELGVAAKGCFAKNAGGTPVNFCE